MDLAELKSGADKWLTKFSLKKKGKITESMAKITGKGNSIFNGQGSDC